VSELRQRRKPYRNSKHLAWLRTRKCDSCGAWVGVQASHCREDTDGGMGIKPSDCFAVTQCDPCHRTVHHLGYDWFEEQTGTPMKEYALFLWLRSPHYEPGVAPE